MAVTSMSQSSIGDFGKRNTFTNPVIVTGGSEIALVGGYRYHLFTESSAFTIVQGGVSAEILVVGAGGSGANGTSGAGGGGGGGAIEIAGPGYYSAQTLTAGTYGVNVGAAGARAAQSQGGSSIFYGTSTITSLGGGSGGNAGPGKAGGSGGGGASATVATYLGGTASGNNTNAGGQATGASGAWFVGAGGGGATAVGANAVANAPGTGGEGLALTTIDSNLTSGNFTAFTGMTVICSGGGGGNTRVTGGGFALGALGGTGAGRGASGGASAPAGTQESTAATSFGSGGGGGNFYGTVDFKDGREGANGLVIVRYAV